LTKNLIPYWQLYLVINAVCFPRCIFKQMPRSLDARHSSNTPLLVKFQHTAEKTPGIFHAVHRRVYLLSGYMH